MNLPGRWEKISGWLVTLGTYSSFQMVVQVFAMIGGLLIVRCMSQQEYAYFTIANSMQGSVNLLADMGIGIGVSAIGGRVWQDRFKLGQVVQTAISLRRKLAVGAALAVVPFFAYFLAHQGASILHVVLLVAIVLASLAAQLSASVLIAVPRFHAQVARIQRLDLGVAAVKLVLIGALCLMLMNASIALCIASITAALPLVFLRPWAMEKADLSAPVNPEYRAEMVGIVRNQAPNALFYCFQGQITVWLISFFGNSKSVAEIGALGRLAVAFSIITAVMNNIVVPRFARCQHRAIVYRRFWQITLLALILAFGLFCLCAVFTDQCLWLLGAKYQHLHKEFLLCVVNAVIAFFIGTIWSMNSARAWIHKSWLYIPGTLAVQVALLPFLDLTKVDGVLLFSILSQVPSLLLNIYMFRRGFHSEFPLPLKNQK